MRAYIDEDEVEAMNEEADKLTQAALVDFEQRRAESAAQARKICEENNVDFDKLMADAAKGQTGPPKPRADITLEQLRDTAQLCRNAGVSDEENKALATLADPTLEPKLRRFDAIALETYRNLAHYFPAASFLEGEESEGV